MVSKHQRTLKNYFLTARQVQGYYFQIAGAGAILVLSLMIGSMNMLSHVQQALSNAHLAEQNAIQEQLFVVMMLYLASFAVFVICTLICMIVVGHRVGGATVAICNYIRDLKRGDFESQRTLRDNDELGPIMMELVDLAQQLKAQQSPKSGQ